MSGNGVSRRSVLGGAAGALAAGAASRTASATEHVPEAVVCVGSDDGGLYGVDAASDEAVWTADAPDDSVSSSPTAVDGVAYVGSVDGSLYAVDVAEGVVAWTRETGGSVRSSPTVVNDRVIVGTEAGEVVAYGRTDGDQRWRSDEPGAAVTSSAAVRDGRAYVGTEGGEVLALSTADGSVAWRTSAPDERVSSSPTAVDGAVYVGSFDERAYAFDAETGDVIWDTDLGDIVFSSPAVVDGTVYVGSVGVSDGLHALAAEDGERLWTAEGPAGVVSSPTVFDGTVYVGSVDASVYAVDGETGQTVWSSDAPGDQVNSSPTVADGSLPGVDGDTLFVGCSDATLYAFGAASGDVRFQFDDPAGPVFSSPTVVDVAGDGHGVGSRTAQGTLGHHHAAAGAEFGPASDAAASLEIEPASGSVPEIPAGTTSGVDFAVENVGSVPARSVRATVSVDGPATSDDSAVSTAAGTLDPGEEEVLTVPLATDDDAAPGLYRFAVELVYETADGGTRTGGATEYSFRVVESGPGLPLGVAESVAVGGVGVGAVVAYRYLRKGDGSDGGGGSPGSTESTAGRAGSGSGSTVESEPAETGGDATGAGSGTGAAETGAGGGAAAAATGGSGSASSKGDSGQSERDSGQSERDPGPARDLVAGVSAVSAATLVDDGGPVAAFAVTDDRIDGGDGRALAFPTADAAAAERFASVATDWGSVSHGDDVVTVYGSGTEPFPWVVTDPVHEVPTLAEGIDGPADDVAERLSPVVDAAEAMSGASRYTVRHYHLSPESIRVVDSGTTAAGLVDGWGIEATASTADRGTRDPSPYTAPEQYPDSGESLWRGKPDVYALAAIAYHAATGEPPTEERPTPPSERAPVPSALDRPLRRALDPDPDERHGSVGGFARALRLAVFD